MKQFFSLSPNVSVEKLVPLPSGRQPARAVLLQPGKPPVSYFGSEANAIKKAKSWLGK